VRQRVRPEGGSTDGRVQVRSPAREIVGPLAASDHGPRVEDRRQIRRFPTAPSSPRGPNSLTDGQDTTGHVEPNPALSEMLVVRVDLDQGEGGTG
jgi:hypothetical protein